MVNTAVSTHLVIATMMLASAPAPKPTAPTPPPPRAAVPKRIVTLAPNAADIICALGAPDRIVGVSRYCTGPGALASRPKVGGLVDPDLERIVALRPDLVILRGRSEAVTNLCRDLGVRVYVDSTESLSDITRTILEIGQILDRSKAATRAVDAFRRRIEAVEKRVADRPRPRVLVTVSRKPDRVADVLTSGKGTFLTEAITIAGGQNVFGQLDMAYPQISQESIVASRPEVILEFMPEAADTKATQERIKKQWRQLGPTPASTTGRIHAITEPHALIPSLRFVEIIEKLSLLLHPEEKPGA